MKGCLGCGLFTGHNFIFDAYATENVQKASLLFMTSYRHITSNILVNESLEKNSMV
jgi:hypothetical protein